MDWSPILGSPATGGGGIANIFSALGSDAGVPWPPDPDSRGAIIGSGPAPTTPPPWPNANVAPFASTSQVSPFLPQDDPGLAADAQAFWAQPPDPSTGTIAQASAPGGDRYRLVPVDHDPFAQSVAPPAQPDAAPSPEFSPPFSTTDPREPGQGDPIWGPVLAAGARGFKDAVGDRPLGLSDEAISWLQSHHWFRDPNNHLDGGVMAPVRAFNELVIPNSAKVLDAAIRTPGAVYSGLQTAGVEGLGLPRDIVSIPDAFLGSPHPFGIPRVKAVEGDAARATIDERPPPDPGGTPEQQAKPENAVPSDAVLDSKTQPLIEPKVGDEDIETVRARYNVPPDDHTIAVGRTNIPGFENELLEGASPEVRRKVKLPEPPPGLTESTSPNPRDRSHAEEVLLNDFDRKIRARGLQPSNLDGTLAIHISNPSGFCANCRAGVGTDGRPGVLKQFSTEYPKMKIHGTVQTDPNVESSGPTDFIILNGNYIYRNDRK